MSSSSTLISHFNLYTAPHGASATHPMLVPNQEQPFTLLQTNGKYTFTFFNRLDAQVRVYARGFGPAPMETLWSATVAVVNESSNDAHYVYLEASPAELNGSTQIWVGCWWDDGTYPGTTVGIQTYFTDHPEGTEHHTVPILVG